MKLTSHSGVSFKNRPAAAEVWNLTGIEQGAPQVDQVEIHVIDSRARRSAPQRFALRISSGLLKSCSLKSSV